MKQTDRFVAENTGVEMKIKKKKGLKIALIILGVLLLISIIGAGGYVYNNLNYDKAPLQNTIKAGFVEKQVTLEDGTILNYGEGPDNGPPLLLLHGQAVTWEDYSPVLPEISKAYHIYALDCHGHGESSKNPQKYTGVAMGKDFIWFIENVIGEPAVVSGHSSGGLLTAWIAANAPQDVRGIVLEDPPIFATEPDRCQKTFIWVDAFKNVHDFLNQSVEKDYILYYLKHSYWKGVFGDMWDGIIQYAPTYRKQHPNETLKIFYIPANMNRMWESISPTYDLQFGNTFYDCSWLEGFDQADTLAKINCPSVLIYASTSHFAEYDQDGILIRAMSSADADRAHSLIKNNEKIVIDCGHDVHYEKPNEFAKIMIDFLAKIK